MVKIICNNILEDDLIYMYLQRNEKSEREHYKNCQKKYFTAEVLKRIMKIENIKDEVIVDIEIKNKEDLIKVINIINECCNINFLLDICDIDVPQRELLKIMNQTMNNKNMVSIKYQNYSGDISYNQYNDMYKEIYKIIDEVKTLDLSPFEQVMYVYDIVKSNIYKENQEAMDRPRDLYGVINSNYIVCVGYSNMMEFILKELGHNINSLKFYYDNKKIGHMRNSIYLTDDKYSIDNILFLDATWDSRKGKLDNEYLDNYRSFLLPYEGFKGYHKNEHFYDEHYKILEYSREEISTIIKRQSYLTDESDRFLILHSLRHIYERKENIGNLITMHMCSKNNEELLKIYNNMLTFYKDSIDHQTFFDCLYRVREKQVQTGRIDHMPDIDEFNNIMIKKYGENYFCTKEQMVFSILFHRELPDSKQILREKHNKLRENTLVKSYN